MSLGLDAALVDDVGDGSSLEVREDVEGLDLTQCWHKAHDRVKQHPLDLPFGLFFSPLHVLLFFLLRGGSFHGHESRLQIAFFDEAPSDFSSSSFLVFVLLVVLHLTLFNTFHSPRLRLSRIIGSEVRVVDINGSIIVFIVTAKVVKVIIIRKGLRAVGGRDGGCVFLLADPLVEEDVEGRLVMGAKDGELGFELRTVREAPETSSIGRAP